MLPLKIADSDGCKYSTKKKKKNPNVSHNSVSKVIVAT